MRWVGHPWTFFNTFLRRLKLFLDFKVIVQIANFVGELAILGRVQVLVWNLPSLG